MEPVKSNVTFIVSSETTTHKTFIQQILNLKFVNRISYAKQPISYRLGLSVRMMTKIQEGKNVKDLRI